MNSQELHAKILATKAFLNREIVRQRTSAEETKLSFREIGTRLDMIHEAERVGIRNLGEIQNRKLTRMISELENLQHVSLN